MLQGSLARRARPFALEPTRRAAGVVALFSQAEQDSGYPTIAAGGAKLMEDRRYLQDIQGHQKPGISMMIVVCMVSPTGFEPVLPA